MVLPGGDRKGLPGGAQQPDGLGVGSGIKAAGRGMLRGASEQRERIGEQVRYPPGPSTVHTRLVSAEVQRSP